MAYVKIASGITDSNGLVDFNYLPYGSYYYQQTSSATGYNISGATVGFTIATASTEADFTAKNNPAETGTMIIYKYNEGSTQWPLSGAQFNLSDSNDKPLLTLTTAADTNGLITLPNLMSISTNPQTYKIREVVAPTGYQLNTSPISVTVSVGATATENVPDIPTQYGKAGIKLVDTNYNLYSLASAGYDLYWDDGQP